MLDINVHIYMLYIYIDIDINIALYHIAIDSNDYPQDIALNHH